jgi:hypothetical protein
MNTDAEKPLSLFRTRIKATSTLHKDLFMIFILPEFNFVSAIFPETRSLSYFDFFSVVMAECQTIPSLL